jgi:hypothetical protein
MTRSRLVFYYDCFTYFNICRFGEEGTKFSRVGIGDWLCGCGVMPWNFRAQHSPTYPLPSIYLPLATLIYPHRSLRVRYFTVLFAVEVEEQVSHVIKLYLRSLRRPLKRVRGLYIYMK